MDLNGRFEGTYGGFTTSINEFVTSRRAGMEQAIRLAEEESKREQ